MAMQVVLVKNIVDATSQFSCPELPKPNKVRAKQHFRRVFSQKKQNPIRAGCDRGFAAFRRRETAT